MRLLESIKRLKYAVKAMEGRGELTDEESYELGFLLEEIQENAEKVVSTLRHRKEKGVCYGGVGLGEQNLS